MDFEDIIICAIINGLLLAFNFRNDLKRLMELNIISTINKKKIVIKLLSLWVLSTIGLSIAVKYLGPYSFRMKKWDVEAELEKHKK